ncbi:hypothetical protein IVIADoCa2_6 [Xanthomonas phage vB_Xar_IVIA-DoCa2]|uniref:Uncharacterized protein n=1 Tax=Xanthomonas phage vB_Xar_IVIA-DoCa2 TaxID=2970491 RepID=A0A976SGX2_9CAUD|nr:hypothetical protein IVIADoCa2_6 [Xanthomonas phage vB_Xar_IVIA-DoCa2]
MKGYRVSAALAAAVRRMAPSYVVLDDAPSTLDGVRAYAEEHGVLAVWSGASENTIWPSPEHNYDFRALHDSIHVKYGHAFDLAGEVATAVDTEKMLRERCPELSEEDYRALWFEVVGQAAYENVNGKFPDDQAAFIADCMLGYSAQLH